MEIETKRLLATLLPNRPVRIACRRWETGREANVSTPLGRLSLVPAEAFIVADAAAARSRRIIGAVRNHRERVDPALRNNDFGPSVLWSDGFSALSERGRRNAGRYHCDDASQT